MDVKRIKQGHISGVCQPWIRRENQRIVPDGFSIHLSIDGIAKYLCATGLIEPVSGSQAYSWIDQLQAPVEIGLNTDMVQRIEASGEFGLRFGPWYALPIESSERLMLFVNGTDDRGGNG